MDVKAPDTQKRYARALAWAMRGALALLVLAFAAYLLGFPAHDPLDRMPQIWNKPAASWLAESGVHAGWDWSRWHRGDSMVIGAIAWLASCAIACLASIVPRFARAGERWFVAICLAQIVVTLLAALGVGAG